MASRVAEIQLWTGTLLSLAATWEGALRREVSTYLGNVLGLQTIPGKSPI